MDFARILRGFCVGFARNLILFLFEREREGYKRFADCTVPGSAEKGDYSSRTSVLFHIYIAFAPILTSRRLLKLTPMC